MTLKIIPDTDPILHTKCEVINPRSPDIPLSDIINEMFSLMVEFNGMGLAAPQVGIKRRFFIMGYGVTNFICINPSIIKASKETEFMEEGCLSYPGVKYMVERSKKVKVRYLTLTGRSVTTTLTGIWARCFLHELDHLNGKTFDERGVKVCPSQTSSTTEATIE